ncbi:MAG: alpha/beta hydrolase, partial [Chloroflexota bacterium]
MMIRNRSTSKQSIICLHASSSTSQQWDAFKNHLENRPYQVVAPDLYGYGQGPLPTDKFSLEDEVDWVLSHLYPLKPFHLIGHSYGGGVALKVAQRVPGRILSLTLFEPAAFGLLKTEKPEDFAEIANVFEEVKQLADSGQHLEATVQFIDYWNGPNAFMHMPEHIQNAVLTSMSKVLLEWNTVVESTSDLAQLTALRMPTLLLSGARSTKVGQSIVALLAEKLSDVRVETLDRLGHMAPVTHPTAVNERIVHFLDEVN